MCSYAVVFNVLYLSCMLFFTLARTTVADYRSLNYKSINQSIRIKNFEEFMEIYKPQKYLAISSKIFAPTISYNT